MIVGDHDIFCIALGPAEDDAILIIYSNRMVAGPIPFQRFKPIGWWNPKVPEIMGGIEHIKFSASYLPDQPGNSTRCLGIGAIINVFRCPVGKSNDHNEI
jgi:hypothetical protein